MGIRSHGEVKVACAVGVAAGIYRAIANSKNNAFKLKRLQMAADALDRTLPLPTFYAHYNTKPADMPDAEFLLDHLSHLCLQTPSSWPRYKVRPAEWGEYTRVMKGMDLVLRADLTQEVLPSRDADNVQALLAFIAPFHPRFGLETVAYLAELAQRWKRQ